MKKKYTEPEVEIIDVGEGLLGHAGTIAAHVDKDLAAGLVNHVTALFADLVHHADVEYLRISQQLLVDLFPLDGLGAHEGAADHGAVAGLGVGENCAGGGVGAVPEDEISHVYAVAD